MITRDEIDLARRAPWLGFPRVDNEGPENSALFLIGMKVEQFAEARASQNVIDEAVRTYADVGLDHDLAETAYKYVKCWG